MNRAMEESTVSIPESGISRGGRIFHSKLNFRFPAMHEAKAFVQDAYGHASWRSKILHFLHDHKVQSILLALLVLDIIVLFVETFLVGHYPTCKFILRDCSACCPTSVDSNANQFLSSDTDEPICKSGYDSSVGYGYCDENKYHTVHTIELVLFGFTIAILSTFFIEINMEMAALGPSAFFRQVWYSLDYIIITVSMTVELLFHFDGGDIGLSSLAGMIVFGRIWRFVRIGHGIVEVTTEYTHQRYGDLLEYAEKLEAEMKKNELPIPKPPKSLHRKSSHEECAVGNEMDSADPLDSKE